MSATIELTRMQRRGITAEYSEIVDAMPRKRGVQYGVTEPRICTPPLRDLTPETSLGFEVIEFAREILGITLYPWQRALLIRGLELREDGSYRFRRIIVLVARQQGKTTLASVLAAWWLFMDSIRHPDQVPPFKFKVVGVAQNLDIAREPWAAVKMWCDPEPETAEEADLAISALQAGTAKVSDTNGKEGIFVSSRAHYEIRAAANARGKPAARVLMDEMREQKDWKAWNAVSQTLKSFWSGQLWGISNAGDASAVVLRQQRDVGLTDVADWEKYVEGGMQSAEEYANTHDVSLGLFEWSAPDGCALEDVDAILQANPSIGYGAMTIAAALADIRGMTDAGYRTEVLCQWVTADVDSFIDVKMWRAQHVDAKSKSGGLQLITRGMPRRKYFVPRGARTVWSVDTSSDRTTSWIAGAVFTDEGLPFVTVRTKRTGMLWVPDYLEQLADESGHREVVVQGKGCPAEEFTESLADRELILHALDGSTFAIATGRIRDRVRDGHLLMLEQPDVDIAVEGGVVRTYTENSMWSRQRSMPIDIAGLVAETSALYGLEVLEPPAKKDPAPPPPPARLLTRADVERSGEVDLATARF
ncbi:hypothetical protein [Microbacterium sp.]|uniref:hypothetical protein n=1 Tax=Microbacterium sp. TaxID=51671 RepID=UPI003F715016